MDRPFETNTATGASYFPDTDTTYRGGYLFAGGPVSEGGRLMHVYNDPFSEPYLFTRFGHSPREIFRMPEEKFRRMLGRMGLKAMN